MPLLQAIQEKLNDALLPLSVTSLTRRDAVPPTVPGKAHAVIVREDGRWI